ncbi:MAG: MFS transporter, partial [Rhodospirillales bacterium]|nr:MFS transporter [Rhodospirillales bacterium]
MKSAIFWFAPGGYEAAMSVLSSRLSLVFSCIGHSYSHLFAPIFYVVALTLEGELGLTHGEVITLIVAGNVLFGFGAPLAGWLGDRWSATGMMALFFMGCGGGMVMTGFAGSPFMIGVWLAVTGLFASIYHPVGFAWLIRNAVNRGTALGINGVFGGIGPAVAALSAGVLTETFGWRSAFIVPGAVMIATGLVFLLLIIRGLIVENKTPLRSDPPVSGRDRVNAFVVLMITMLCTGLIYQSTQAALPKMFDVRLQDMVNSGVMGVSAMVAVIYLTAGAMQVVAGRLADRYPLKTVYLIAFFLQAPILFLVALSSGTFLFIAALAMVTANVGALPAENSLVARFAPSHWHGLAFGLKFIFAFGISGLGARLEGVLYDQTGGFFWLFT